MAMDDGAMHDWRPSTTVGLAGLEVMQGCMSKLEGEARLSLYHDLLGESPLR